MSDYLYFDAAASAPPCKQAIAAAEQAYKEYANPSSVHKAGLAAKRMLEHAREQVARAFRCETGELFFTSSGTEANNLILFGLAARRARVSRKILTTDSEHPSVDEPLKKLEAQGFRVVRLSTRGGRLNTEQLRAELAEPIAFLSIMQANNETGALYDIRAVRELLDEFGSDAPLHCDAVQGFLKAENSECDLSSLCDFATLSAHKIGGLKGAGAAYLGSKAIRIPALLLGGGQESGMRSGTENVAALAAFGAAAEAVCADSEHVRRIGALRSQVIDGLEGSGILLHLPPNALANILHISIPNVPSSWALNLLSEQGICVSAGSACSAQGRKKGNRVLSAYGLPPQEIETSLRISFSEQNTKEECARLCKALRDCADWKK